MHTLAAKAKQEYVYRNISFFKGLNTLRFFAAFLVVIHHSESMKLKNGIESLGALSLLHQGHYAVTFFFVLSGFLMTYFLLKERNRTDDINVRKFYRKRVLRIFPLYFLLVIIGTVIVPFFVTLLGVNYEIPYTFGQSWYFYILFLPSLVTFYYGHHLLEPLWSIGVEMFFYIIWAPLLKCIRKNVLPLLLSIIAIKALLAALPYIFRMPALYEHFVNIYLLESMAVGGLGAYFIFNLKKGINSYLLFRKSFQFLIIGLLMLYIVFDQNIDNPLWNMVFKTPIISPLFVYSLSLYLILAVSLCGERYLNIENKVSSYLGEISYGIYMYHTTVISVVILLIQKIPLHFNAIISNLIFYVLTISGTLLVSHLSKKYFEDYFLSLKNKVNTIR